MVKSKTITYQRVKRQNDKTMETFGRNSRLIHAVAYKNAATECFKLCGAAECKAAMVSGRKKQQLQALDYDCKTGKSDKDDVSGRVRFFEKANSL